MSEQFATTQLMERHENVVQGATVRRKQREVPTALTSTRVKKNSKERTHSAHSG